MGDSGMINLATTCRASIVATVVAMFVATALFALPAHADLEDFILDLHGGADITLPPDPDLAAINPAIANAHEAHFSGAQQIAQLAALSSGILTGIGEFSLNSTVTGVTFDLSTGTPMVVEDSLGPLLAERASTMGKGRLSLSFAYTNQSFDELDGDSLNGLTVNLSHDDCCTLGGGPPNFQQGDGALTSFEEDVIQLNIDLDIEREVFAFQANYGVTDNFDIGIIVPVVSVTAESFSRASVLYVDPTGDSVFAGNPDAQFHSFEGDPTSATDSLGGDETGLGDVILRGKMNVLSADQGSGVDLALLAQITLPTGDEENLLGTGESQYRGMLVLSKQMGRITPHLNLAYSLASHEADFENFTYALGFDARISQTFTAAVDILGRRNPNLEFIGDHQVDLAVAAKWNPFSKMNAPINAFVRVPLNDDGLRADVIWGVGIDFIFD